MAKDLGHSKDNVVSTDFDVKRKCKDCQAEFLAKKTMYKNGDIVYSPERCDMCQTSHLANVRVSKVLDGLKGIKNIVPRIVKHFGDKGKDAIKDEITKEVETMLDALYGTGPTQVKTGFNLKNLTK